MGFDIAVQDHDFSGNEDRRWLASRKGYDTCRSITLDVSSFDPAHIAEKGVIPSGTVLAKISATGLYGPYSGKTDEVQTLTVGGSGLTSFTITYSGQTTDSIPADATGADVEEALVALSNIGPDDVTVTGPEGGPWVVSFGGALANTDVAALTTTPTGGTGTVTVTTTVAGGAEGSDGRQVAEGFLFTSVKVGGQGNAGSDTDLSTAANVGATLCWEGIIDRSKLPTFEGTDDGILDADAEADMPHFRFEGVM